MGITPPTSGSYEKYTPNTLRLKEGASSPPAKISDIAWYAGHWVGTGFNAKFEESVGPAMGDSMVGSFRMIQEDKPVFYEFVIILEEYNSSEYARRSCAYYSDFSSGVLDIHCMRVFRC